MHFQFAAAEGLDCARNSYLREAERRYRGFDDHLAGRNRIVGDACTIADIWAWGCLDRTARVLGGEVEQRRPTRTSRA